ncbi:MAG: hypothetical protein HKN52_00730 [Eudoraea sp.]|nr:hypothetical protein [Eudoraea sp.]
MLAVITGDIINSENYPSSVWMPLLKDRLGNLGVQPLDWDIYRGDEFQLKIAPAKALRAAIHLKAVIKTIQNLDIRLGIGVGEETYTGERITESNGSAYQRSGRIFETLKEQKLTLALATGSEEQDRVLNLMIRLGLNFMDDWSRVSAEIVAWELAHPNTSQKEIAKHFKIQQSAVSQRQKRARLDLVLDLLHFYEESITQRIL